MSEMVTYFALLALIFMGAMVGLLITVVCLLLLFVRRVSEIVLEEYFRRKTQFMTEVDSLQEDVIDG